MNKLIEQILDTINCCVIESKRVNHKMVHTLHMRQQLSKDMVEQLNQVLVGYRLDLKKDYWSNTNSLILTKTNSLKGE